MPTHIIQKRDLIEMLAPFDDRDRVVVSFMPRGLNEFERIKKLADNCDTDRISDLRDVVEELSDLELSVGGISFVTEVTRHNGNDSKPWRAVIHTTNED
jgi:hypothetical protein